MYSEQLLKNRDQKPPAQEINEWATDIWANRLELAKTPGEVLFTDARDATANFWRMKADNTDSQMTVERERPGARKEIPECEAVNKYGNAARGIYRICEKVRSREIQGE